MRASRMTGRRRTPAAPRDAGQRTVESARSPRLGDALSEAAPTAFVALPASVAFVATMISAEGEHALALAVLLSIVAGGGSLAATRASESATFLPLVRLVYKAAGAVSLAVVLGLLALLDDRPASAWPAVTVLLVLLCSLAIPLSGPFRRHGARAVRLAVVGTDQDALDLSRQLAAAGEDGFEVMGHVGVERWTLGDQSPAPIGTLDTLVSAVDEYELDLLLMGPAAPRMEIFSAVSRRLLGDSVRLMELSSFYETAFGHVPLNAINDSWFQCLLHPSHRSRSPLSRALDLAIAAAMTIALAPLVVVLALLIRRDGGPVLYRQTRIGEGGRPFEIYKLRTMRPSDGPTPWTTVDDDRITPIGRFLRRTHLDELPQLFNVLRGDMAIVGPRPEQPAIVETLERIVPFYDRRHYARPGVTGWAQVRCGYAGSNIGSAWKVSHDLYYAKHRSFKLDVMILVETVRTLVADQQYGLEPAGLMFLLPVEHHVDEHAAA
jgi:exopolysaccharide biosynthesis polyprenyl glycosylphosphotransferase